MQIALPTRPTMSTMMTDRLSMYMGSAMASSGCRANEPHQMETSSWTNDMANMTPLR